MLLLQTAAVLALATGLAAPVQAAEVDTTRGTSLTIAFAEDDAADVQKSIVADLSRGGVRQFDAELYRVGSYTAECLARSGVGELTIVDNDSVSVTNRNRQLEALSSTVGQKKTDAVAARLLDINPDLRLHPICETYDAAHRERFFPEGCRYDYIADAIDLVSCKLDLAETALRNAESNGGPAAPKLLNAINAERAMHGSKFGQQHLHAENQQQ